MQHLTAKEANDLVIKSKSFMDKLFIETYEKIKQRAELGETQIIYTNLDLVINNVFSILRKTLEDNGFHVEVDKNDHVIIKW